jgi:hypothetical protein
MSTEIMRHTPDRITEIGGALDYEGVSAIAGALGKLPADVFALYLKTKGFHWHIRGPHFQAPSGEFVGEFGRDAGPEVHRSPC